MRASRLLVATLLIPITAFVAYTVALYTNFDDSYVDANGSALGAILAVAATFGISKVAADDRWTERAGTALALASAYFLLTWARFGEPALSPDSQPHIVWFAFCVVAFTPAVVLIPASKWAWATYRSRVPLRSSE